MATPITSLGSAAAASPPNVAVPLDPLPDGMSERAGDAWSRTNDAWDRTGEAREMWSRWKTMGSAMARHSINNLGGLGIPGHAWNVRDAYRTSYDDDRRIGAKVGDALTLGFVGLMVHAWRTQRFAVPSVWNLPAPVIQTAAVGLLALGATSGIARTYQNTQDDGDLSGVGGAVGVAAGALLSRVVPGRWPGRIAMVAGVALGGIAGYRLGERAKFSDGHIEEDYAEPSRLQDKPALAAGRGFWTHFVEAGPLSSGTGFGSSWGQVSDMQHRYTDAELGAGMAGDVLAGGIAGTTALIATGRILGRAESSRLTNTPLARLGMELSIPARVVNRMKNVVTSVVTISRSDPHATGAAVERIVEGTAANIGRRRHERLSTWISKFAVEYDGRVPQALYLAGAGLLAYTLHDAWKTGESAKNQRIGGPLNMALTGAGVAVGAAALMKWGPGIKHLPMATRPGMALVAASASAAALTTIREPIMSFIDGAGELHRRRGVELDKLSGAAVGVGALGGALVGMRASKIMEFSGAWRAGFVLAGAISGGAIGWGFAPMLSPAHESRGPQPLEEDVD